MNRIKNGIFVGMGFIVLGLGIIGMVLPVLPTTPFFLLATLFFAKGSKRFHIWFIKTEIYKKYIEQMVNKKEMTKETKRKMMYMITLLFTIGFVFSPVWYAKCLIGIIYCIHLYIFLFRIKTSVSSEDIERKRQLEKMILISMIHTYCCGMHDKEELCEDCKRLESYAMQRTDQCPFMETKTFCSACNIHCYSEEMQNKIKEVMKYAGPRMILYHPIVTLKHGLTTLSRKRKK